MDDGQTILASSEPPETRQSLGLMIPLVWLALSASFLVCCEEKPAPRQTTPYPAALSYPEPGASNVRVGGPIIQYWSKWSDPGEKFAIWERSEDEWLLGLTDLPTPVHRRQNGLNDPYWAMQALWTMDLALDGLRDAKAAPLNRAAGWITREDLESNRDVTKRKVKLQRLEPLEDIEFTAQSLARVFLECKTCPAMLFNPDEFLVQNTSETNRVYLRERLTFDLVSLFVVSFHPNVRGFYADSIPRALEFRPFKDGILEFVPEEQQPKAEAKLLATAWVLAVLDLLSAIDNTVAKQLLEQAEFDTQEGAKRNFRVYSLFRYLTPLTRSGEYTELDGMPVLRATVQLFRHRLQHEASKQAHPFLFAEAEALLLRLDWHHAPLAETMAAGWVRFAKEQSERDASEVLAETYDKAWLKESVSQAIASMLPRVSGAINDQAIQREIEQALEKPFDPESLKLGDACLRSPKLCNEIWQLDRDYLWEVYDGLY